MPTWELRRAEHLAHPAGRGASTVVSTFIASSTARGSPAATSSPSWTASDDDHGRGRRAHDLAGSRARRGGGCRPPPRSAGSPGWRWRPASSARRRAIVRPVRPGGPRRHLQAEAVHLDAEARAVEAGDAEEVVLAAMAQLDGAADLLRHLGPAARRRGVETRAGGGRAPPRSRRSPRPAGPPRRRGGGGARRSPPAGRASRAPRAAGRSARGGPGPR